MSGNEDAEARRSHHQPHSAKHPVPTVQDYKSRKQDQRDRLEEQHENQQSDYPSKTDELKDRATNYWNEHYGGSNEESNGDIRDGQWQPNSGAYGSTSQSQPEEHHDHHGHDPERLVGHDEVKNMKEGGAGNHQQYQGMADTSQVSHASNPKEKRKEMKKRVPERAERQVTDPVTHLPITIQDFTDGDLHELQSDGEEPNEKSLGTRGRSGTGEVLNEAAVRGNEVHQGMMKVFPPPDFELARQELASIHMHMYTIGLSVVAVVSVAMASFWFSVVEPHPWNRNPFVRFISATLVTVAAAVVIAFTIYIAQDVGQKKVKEVWDDSVWASEKKSGRAAAKNQDPESVQWLNMVLGSLWPLVNPDLFTSVADMLEDVMQASLPKVVRMVSVDDIGQGSESIRILGIKWLPRSAAKKSVSSKGDLTTPANRKGNHSSVVYGNQGTEDASEDVNQRQLQGNEKDEQQAQDTSVAPGMEAEEGDFFNLEVAFAYKTSRVKRRFRERAKNMHLYLSFYLPGHIRLPVYVELRGLVGTVRLRLQTSPDPPFLGLCTMTLLGQPRVDLSCVPLVRKGLNLMDVPFISNFVQSAVDAAMSEYVAPKSLTIDLKAMLAGEDYKTETTARGALLIRIKRAYDFKKGDISIPLISKGGSDGYVSVGWAKFGKPLWSTRIIESEMHPYWEEQTYMLVGPEELDAQESLRVQLWDSDRTSADDDLGRIEIDLKHLMTGEETNGKMQDRTDDFHSLDEEEGMPGRLEWSVGYFSKARLLDNQVRNWSKDGKFRTVEQLKKAVYEDAADKLSETARDENSEIAQQQKDDFHAKSEEIMNGSTPATDYPSGIISVQLHQIVRLEYGKLNKERNPDYEEDLEENEQEGSDDLPSCYCNVIINHAKVYKTRTKPKNPQPFFNAATERFVRDWQTTSVMVSARDARVHEDDALLGVVYLPIGEIFRQKQCSRFNGYYPLAGGSGTGKIRISVVFRSLQLQLPRHMLGWDYGTLEIAPEVSCTDKMSNSLLQHRLKFRTKFGKGKMQARKSDGTYGDWSTSNGKPLRLAVSQRYASQLIIEFRTSSTILRDKTPAWAVLRLGTIPDEEEQNLILPIYEGDLKRAETNHLPDSEMGKKVGELKLRVTFWRGLGHAHSQLASQEVNVDEVMEVLQTIYDTQEHGDSIGLEGWRNGGDYADLDNDSSDDETGMKGGRFSHDGTGPSHEFQNMRSSTDLHRAQTSDTDVSKRNSGGSILGDLRNYRRNKDRLHRQGRGAMQWKVPRTMAWMKHKAEHATEKVKDQFSHQERQPDIETEV